MEKDFLHSSRGGKMLNLLGIKVVNKDSYEKSNKNIDDCRTLFDNSVSTIAEQNFEAYEYEHEFCMDNYLNLNDKATNFTVSNLSTDAINENNEVDSDQNNVGQLVDNTDYSDGDALTFTTLKPCSVNYLKGSATTASYENISVVNTINEISTTCNETTTKSEEMNNFNPSNLPTAASTSLSDHQTEIITFECDNQEAVEAPKGYTKKGTPRIRKKQTFSSSEELIKKKKANYKAKHNVYPPCEKCRLKCTNKITEELRKKN